jgi:hypothetical protein
VVIAGSDKTTRRRGIRRQRDASLSYGPELHEARERLGLSLDTVQDRTGVRRFHLEALEEGDLSRFPDEKTALVAVRRYAEILGLDGPTMMQIVGDQWRKVTESPTSALVGATVGAPRTSRDTGSVPVPVPVIPIIPVGNTAPATGEVAMVGAHLSRFPGDASHLKSFTQTAQVPQVAPRVVHPTLPPGLRFDSTDSLPVTRRYRDPYPAPVALQVAVWTTVVLLTLGVAGIAVHHWRPAWLAKIHLVAGPAPAGTSRGHGTPPKASNGPVVSGTPSGPLAEAVQVRSPVFAVVVVTQAPCWIHVTSPTSFAPVFSATVPAGTTKTFTSGNGHLSVELGASHVTVTVQVLGKTIPGWSLSPSSAPYVVNFSSTTS